MLTCSQAKHTYEVTPSKDYSQESGTECYGNHGKNPLAKSGTLKLLFNLLLQRPHQ